MVEEGSGRSDGVPVVLIKRSVEIVGAGSCNERDLGARGAALIGGTVQCSCAKLLHRIKRHAQDASKSSPTGLVVDVDPVESDVRLIRLSTVDRAVTIIGLRGSGTRSDRFVERAVISDARVSSQ